MIASAALLPKLAVFLIAAVIGGSSTYIAASAVNRPALVSTATEAEFEMTAPAALAVAPGGPGPAVAFDLIDGADAGIAAEELLGLAPEDLDFAAAALLTESPIIALNPTGFPRIPPVSQFDGGPYASANCTLAAGAMLARLGWGIVTTGSILRTLQDDQVGGTGLDDLAVALWRGYGVTFNRGLLNPSQFRSLLSNGYGAVIQGVYGKIPAQLRLQSGFTGPHAIFIDGYYPGDANNPPAYYVIDPLGRPQSGYTGDWWPASIVDDFATSLGFAGGRIAAAWVYPPGGVPPDVGIVDVPNIPPSGGDTPTDEGPMPSPDESTEPGASPTPTPGVIVPEPGDITVDIAQPDPGVEPGVVVGDVVLIPQLLVCLAQPPPPGCPEGKEGVFKVPSGPIPQVEVNPGPEVKVAFVDSTQANVALVGFTVNPPAPADVRFWAADGSPPVIGQATSMMALNFLGKTTIVARLDVLASKTYHFQVLAGNGLIWGTSPVGTFTTANGVSKFEVSLAAAADPVFRLGQGFSPYVHLATDGVVAPLEPCLEVQGNVCLIRAGTFDVTNAVRCSGIARFDGTPTCLRRLEPEIGPPLPVCQRANVAYRLDGIDASGVLVRAFPAEKGVLPDGGVTLEGVLEAEGPAGEGEVGVGCLASGKTYTIVIDAIGDDRGILTSAIVDVP